MFFYISIILIIIGTVFYDFIEKTVPKDENLYLHLILTYSTALMCLFVGLNIIGYNVANLIEDINVQSLLVGVAAMFVDYGLLLSYKKGWKISTLNITYTISVLVILTLISWLLLGEHISYIKMFGIILCLLSIFLMNHKKVKKGGRR